MGTFTQEVLFDFGVAQYVGRKVTVHVGLSQLTFERMATLEDLISSKNSWNCDNCEIMWISKERYHQNTNRDVITNLALDGDLNDSSYFPTMEKWIHAEEMRRQSILSR